MRISLQFSVLAIAAMLAAGCRDKPPKPPGLSEALPNLPLPPLATVVGRSGGENALQITFLSTLPPDRIADYYRLVLSRNEWTLVNDTKMADGKIALYAERSGPPLWVTIAKDSAGVGTLIVLNGAVPKPDTTKARADSAKRS
jgi:hypothetical protein